MPFGGGRFSQKFSKTQTKGLKHLFTKHLEIGARFLKRLK
jgi:hypothetical protein